MKRSIRIIMALVGVGCAVALSDAAAGPGARYYGPYGGEGAWGGFGPYSPYVYRGIPVHPIPVGERVIVTRRVIRQPGVRTCSGRTVTRRTITTTRVIYGPAAVAEFTNERPIYRRYVYNRPAPVREIVRTGPAFGPVLVEGELPWIGGDYDLGPTYLRTIPTTRRVVYRRATVGPPYVAERRVIYRRPFVAPPVVGERVVADVPVVGGDRTEIVRTTPTVVGEGPTEPGPTVAPAYPNAWVDYANPYR